MTEDSPSQKIGKILDTVASLPKRLAEAIHDEMKNKPKESLYCVDNKGIVDFNLIEKDVKEIEDNLKASGNTILGRRFIFDNIKNIAEFRIYTEKDNKTFLNTTKIEVKQIINAPTDVLEEIKSKGYIELNLPDNA
jgi:hypothetical protein